MVVYCYGLLVERRSVMAFWPPPQMTTVVDGTDPTGMHSCLPCMFL